MAPCVLQRKYLKCKRGRRIGRPLSVPVHNMRLQFPGSLRLSAFPSLDSSSFSVQIAGTAVSRKKRPGQAECDTPLTQ
eukprot:747652-Pleurochrysis_carterae.AAC.3